MGTISAVPIGRGDFICSIVYILSAVLFTFTVVPFWSGPKNNIVGRTYDLPKFTFT